MRVIAGTRKGRILMAPKGRATRPTGDRVKEAIFSMIGPYFSAGVCLDLFAGSGALGLEALSRGMELAIFVDKASVQTVRANVEALSLSAQARILHMPFTGALAYLSSADIRCNLVFVDPPYQAGLLERSLTDLVGMGVLADAATVVAEMEQHMDTPKVGGLVLRKEAVYGITKVCIYQSM